MNLIYPVTSVTIKLKIAHQNTKAYVSFLLVEYLFNGLILI